MDFRFSAFSVVPRIVYASLREIDLISQSDHMPRMLEETTRSFLNQKILNISNAL